MVTHLLNIHIPQINKLDQLVWQLAKDGQYSVKSGFFLVMKECQTLHHPGNWDSGGCWKKLWKLNLPGKWASFIWKIFHRILIVKNLLVHWGIPLDLVCSRCGVEEESLEHLCFQCIFSKHIWRGSSLGLNFEDGEGCLVHDWMGQWFQKAPDDDDAIGESVKVLWGIFGFIGIKLHLRMWWKTLLMF